jgi:hypothetical protein
MDSSLQEEQRNHSHNVHESAVKQQAHAPCVSMTGKLLVS